MTNKNKVKVDITYTVESNSTIDTDGIIQDMVLAIPHLHQPDEVSGMEIGTEILEENE